MKFNLLMSYLVVFFLGMVLFSCKIETARPAKKKQLVIASDYLSSADAGLFKNFSKRMNIKVKIINVSPDKIISKFEQDRFNSGIDIIMIKSLTSVIQLHKKKVLHPLKNGIHFGTSEAGYSSEKYDYVGFGYDPFIVAESAEHRVGIRMFNDLTRHKFETNLSQSELIPLFAPILSKKNKVDANAWVKKFYDHSKIDSTYVDSIGLSIPILTTYSEFHARENQKEYKGKTFVYPNKKSTGTFYNLRTICIANQSENYDEALAFINYYILENNNKSLNKKLNTIGTKTNAQGFRKFHENSEKLMSYYLTIERLIIKLEKL